jgi:membrane protein implicated in regulation of membrane protease activity
MALSKKKLAGIIAGLCILCCAAPIAALLVGGAGLAALSPMLGTELKYVSLALGPLGVIVAIYLFWRRSRKAPQCDID